MWCSQYNMFINDEHCLHLYRVAYRNVCCVDEGWSGCGGCGDKRKHVLGRDSRQTCVGDPIRLQYPHCLMIQVLYPTLLVVVPLQISRLRPTHAYAALRRFLRALRITRGGETGGIEHRCNYMCREQEEQHLCSLSR